MDVDILYWLNVATENTKIGFWGWVNNNDGVVMCILTLVYVVATCFIWNSNKKSADAATEANKQNYALTLLDKRLTSYYTLNDWVSIGNMLYAYNKERTPVELFNAMLFNNPKNIELEEMNSKIQDIENEMEKCNSDIVRYSELATVRKSLLQKRLFKRIAVLDAESGLIAQIEILFSTVNYESVKEFKDDFMRTVIDSSDKNVEKLKKDLQKLLDECILENMWEEMKIKTQI